MMKNILNPVDIKKHICDRHIKPKAGVLILSEPLIIYSSYRPICFFALFYSIYSLN